MSKIRDAITGTSRDDRIQLYMAEILNDRTPSYVSKLRDDRIQLYGQNLRKQAVILCVKISDDINGTSSIGENKLWLRAGPNLA